MEILDLALLEKLSQPGPRIPWIKKWLIEDIWSVTNYQNLVPTEYLRQGEEKINQFETLLASAAWRVYEELLSTHGSDKNLLSLLSDSQTAVVIFDGLSLRELPILQKLARQSGLTIKSVDCYQAAIPSETIDFVERELNCGRVAPSQLPARKEFKEKNISVCYTSSPIQGITNGKGDSSLLIWSAFPDNTYKDSGARYESHFENIHTQFETAWLNTVQQIKGKKRIIITSDHGYIYFGPGMDSPRGSQELNSYFGNDRSVSLKDKPDPPPSDEIVVDSTRQVALVKGRVRTKSTGEAAVKLYRHGGLSLMEMLTPWLVLEA